MPTLPLILISPVILFATAALFLRAPGRRPGGLLALSEGAALGVLGLSVAALMQLWMMGPMTFGAGGPLSVRLDLVSGTLTTLVAFVGWIVLRFSRRYLDGEAREGAFHGLTLAAVGAVLVLVQAGSLALLVVAFVAVGLLLRQLLLFYPDRPEARRAATKFTRVWVAGDVALMLAALLLWRAFGTLDIAAITGAVTANSLGLGGHVAVVCLMVAALCKTAAFPLHGWLTEVMEAPTPVSALLHAGIINSGGVLLIMLAPVVQQSPGVMAALVMLGGLTALFGAVVMLTQSAVKTALAWSTVGQMGFMLLQCGLGLWALALLHIVAHSLYKAHAFLTAGGAIDDVAAVRRPGPVAVPGPGAVARAFVLALVLYGAVAALFAVLIGPKSEQALALGAMLIFGVAYLIAQGMADAAPRALTLRTGLASLVAATGYFGFQVLAGALWGGNVPAPPVPGPLEWALIVLAVLTFGIVAVAQALFPLWAHHPSTAGLRVHLANGLYLNALFDRLTGGFRVEPKT